RPTAARMRGNICRKPVWKSSGSSPRTRNWLKVKPAGAAICGKGARRDAELETARRSAPGPKLLHVADAGERERVETGRRRGGDGRSDRLRIVGRNFTSTASTIAAPHSPPPRSAAPASRA